MCLPAFPGSHGSVILAGGTEGFRMGDQKLRAKTINASNSGIVVTCKGCVWIGSWESFSCLLTCYFLCDLNLDGAAQTPGFSASGALLGSPPSLLQPS